MWNLSFLTLDIRDFSFKMINNKLNFNASLAHFSESVQNSACSFCTLSRNLPPPKETIKHFFTSCPVSTSFASNYFNNFLNGCDLTFSNDWLLLGVSSDIFSSKAFIINIEIVALCLFLFKCRLRTKLPLHENFKEYIDWTENFGKK